MPCRPTRAGGRSAASTTGTHRTRGPRRPRAPGPRPPGPSFRRDHRSAGTIVRPGCSTTPSDARTGSGRDSTDRERDGHGPGIPRTVRTTPTSSAFRDGGAPPKGDTTPERRHATADRDGTTRGARSGSAPGGLADDAGSGLRVARHAFERLCPPLLETELLILVNDPVVPQVQDRRGTIGLQVDLDDGGRAVRPLMPGHP